jgi:hypothetical protein
LITAAQVDNRLEDRSKTLVFQHFLQKQMAANLSDVVLLESGPRALWMVAGFCGIGASLMIGFRRPLGRSALVRGIAVGEAGNGRAACMAQDQAGARTAGSQSCPSTICKRLRL